MIFHAMQARHTISHTYKYKSTKLPNRIECEQSIKTLKTWFLAFFCRKPLHIIASWSGTKYCEALAINMSSRRRRETKCVLWLKEFHWKSHFLIDYVKTHYTNKTQKKRWLMICCQVMLLWTFVFLSSLKWRTDQRCKISHMNSVWRKIRTESLINSEWSEDLFGFMCFLWLFTHRWYAYIYWMIFSIFCRWMRPK